MCVEFTDKLVLICRLCNIDNYFIAIVMWLPWALGGYDWESNIVNRVFVLPVLSSPWAHFIAPRKRNWGTITMVSSVRSPVRSSATLFVVSMHFLTNRSGDWYQTWWIHSLTFTPQTWSIFGHALMNFFCFLASDWSRSFHAFADKPLVGLRWNLVGKRIVSPDPISVWSRSTEFTLFPGLWFVEQFPRIHGQTAGRIGLRFGGPTHYGPVQGRLTSGHSPLVFRCFLVSGWSSNSCAFTDKPFIGLGSTLMGQLIIRD